MDPWISTGNASRQLRWETPESLNGFACCGWIYIFGQPINSTWFDVCFGQFPTCLEPVEYAGFMLKPNGFFDGNPAHDLAVEKNVRSIDERATAGTNVCCH